MNRVGKNGVMLLALLACVAGMLGVAYASVPLYRLFCRATGFGGTTQRVTFGPNGLPGLDAVRSSASPQTRNRWVTMTFDGNVQPGLPWDFRPDVKSLRVRLGEIVNVTYRAHNRGTRTLVGTSSFNVQPDKAGSYFDKIQCFCFTEQVLKPGETAALPVQFYVDPALADDHQTDDVQNITLSYTFFPAKNQGSGP